MISYAEQAQARYLEEAEAHRVQAARSLAAWWTLARWFTARPHPVFALLLAPDRESLAHRAEYLPKWAEISRGAADEEGRRLTLFRSEYEGLARPAAAPENRDRPYFVVGQWKGGGDVDIWHVEEAPANPGERTDLCDEYREDADNAFGSVEIVYAGSPEAAAEQARREARETSERIHRELPARRPIRPLPGVAYRQAAPAPAPDHEERCPVARFAHATPERCAQLRRALTAASLGWSDNGRQDDPQFLTYTVTDPHGRMWQVSPATNFQISPGADLAGQLRGTDDEGPGPVRPPGGGAHQGVPA